MTTPPLRLDEGEQVLITAQALRKKGIFGNRFGEIYVTDKRVAFVKAIMRSGVISAAVKARGAKPILEMSRTSIAVGTEPAKKMTLLTVTDGQSEGRFLLAPDAIAQIVSAIQS